MLAWLLDGEVFIKLMRIYLNDKDPVKYIDHWLIKVVSVCWVVIHGIMKLFLYGATGIMTAAGPVIAIIVCVCGMVRGSIRVLLEGGILDSYL